MELSEATWHLRQVLKQVLPPWPVVISIRTVLDALEAADRLSYERGQVDGYKAGRRDGVQASLDALHQLKQLEEAYERQDYTAYCVSVDSNLG